MLFPADAMNKLKSKKYAYIVVLADSSPGCKALSSEPGSGIRTNPHTQLLPKAHLY